MVRIRRAALVGGSALALLLAGVAVAPAANADTVEVNASIGGVNGIVVNCTLDELVDMILNPDASDCLFPQG